MLGVHALIGAGEAVITVAAVSAVLSTRPDLVRGRARAGVRMKLRLFTIVALAVAIGLATAASPFASRAPDGLERVAADHAFATQRADARTTAPLPATPSPACTTRASPRASPGFAGTLLVFASASPSSRRAETPGQR